MVLHENGLSSEPFEQEIAENADNLWLHIPRRQGNKDATAGWIFLTVLSVIPISLAIIYVALHNNDRRSSSVQSAVFLNQVDKVIQQLTESTKPSEDTELNTSMATIQNIWDVIAGATTLPQSKPDILLLPTATFLRGPNLPPSQTLSPFPVGEY